MRTSARTCACTCSSEDDFRESVRTFPPAEARSLFFARLCCLLWASWLSGLYLSSGSRCSEITDVRHCAGLSMWVGSRNETWVFRVMWLELLPLSHLPSRTVLFLKAFVLGAMTLSWLCSCQQPPPNVLSTLTSGAQGTTIHS